MYRRFDEYALNKRAKYSVFEVIKHLKDAHIYEYLYAKDLLPILSFYRRNIIGV